MTRRKSRNRLTVAVALVVSCLLGGPVISVQGPDPALAESLAEKLTAIIHEHDRGDHAGSMETEVSEMEANAYLLYRLEDQLPEGLEEPWVRFNDGAVEAGATLDLALVQERMPSGSVLQLLSGRVPVELGADVIAEDGKGRLNIERCMVGGFSLPPSLLQELVTSYTKSPSRPDGIRLDEPFGLPYGISSMRVQEGQVVLRQGG